MLDGMDRWNHTQLLIPTPWLSADKIHLLIAMNLESMAQQPGRAGRIEFIVTHKADERHCYLNPRRSLLYNNSNKAGLAHKDPNTVR